MLSFKKKIYKPDNLYNSVLKLSRNKLLYINLNLTDTFYTRIYLIFFHLSFLIIKIKDTGKPNNRLCQNIFDFTFNQIELNMREIGYGDVQVNKNMKLLVRTFYNILLNCEKFKSLSLSSKNTFFIKYLEQNSNQKIANNELLIKYFDKFQAFCFDLIPDSVLKELVCTDSIKPARILEIANLRYVSIAALLGRAINNVHNEESVSSLLYDETWEE